MARIVARAILAAAAFWFALLVLPRLSWNADSSLLPRIVILAEKDKVEMEEEIRSKVSAGADSAQDAR